MGIKVDSSFLMNLQSSQHWIFQNSWKHPEKKKLHDSVNRAVSFSGGNIPQEEIDLSVKHILEFEMHMNPDFEDAFAEYAYDLAMNNLLKELGIKYNPDSDAARNHSERAVFILCECQSVKAYRQTVCFDRLDKPETQNGNTQQNRIGN